MVLAVSKLNASKNGFVSAISYKYPFSDAREGARHIYWIAGKKV
jgi:hypothetical protein